MTVNRGYGYPPHESQASELHDARKFDTMFIHSRVDELRLSPAEFRIYAHLSRRVARREAYPSVSSMARICCMNEQTVRDSLDHLIAYGMVHKIERPGFSNVYHLTEVDDWKPEIVGTIPSSRHVREHPTPVERGDTPLFHTPVEKREGYPCGKKGGDPCGKKGDEVHPLKLIQVEVNPDTAKQVRSPAGRRNNRRQKNEEQLRIENDLKKVWFEEYRSRFGKEYTFQGKDWTAIERLAKSGQSSEEIILTAKKAWELSDRFLANISAGIAGFASVLNQIHAELARQETPTLPT